MVKKYILFLACCFLWISKGMAQNSGMLPITGIHYFKEGIWAKSIIAKMNGQQLMVNRIPFSTEIEINLQQLTGFTTDKLKKIFPAAQYSLVSAKGDTLQQMANLLLLNQAKGFTPKDLAKGLSLKFGIAEGLVQPNSKCIICIRLYDQKGKNQLRLEYPVSMSYPREKIPVTDLAPQVLKSPVGSIVMAYGLTVKNIEFTIDTSISYNPKMTYLHFEISRLAGIDMINMLAGKENFWVYDTLYNEIKVNEKILKDVGGAMGENYVNCKLLLPFRFKTEHPKGYIIRYRWDGPDKTQALDIVVTVK